MADDLKTRWDQNNPGEVAYRTPPVSARTQVPISSLGEGIAANASTSPRFRYRILVVDDNPSIRQLASATLENEGYEVLTASDGLEGLDALSFALPDVIISDLNMPRMSGFEFLAVVRNRFPHIATIAISGEFMPGDNPSGILADAFLAKGDFSKGQLFHEVAKVLAASPIRSEREKSDLAPLFVPRDRAGYLVITCSKCLRPNKLDAGTLDGGIHQTNCQSCGAPIRFEINHEVEPLLKSMNL